MSINSGMLQPSGAASVERALEDGRRRRRMHGEKAAVRGRGHREGRCVIEQWRKGEGCSVRKEVSAQVRGWRGGGGSSTRERAQHGGEGSAPEEAMLVQGSG